MSLPREASTWALALAKMVERPALPVAVGRVVICAILSLLRGLGVGLGEAEPGGCENVGDGLRLWFGGIGARRAGSVAGRSCHAAAWPRSGRFACGLWPLPLFEFYGGDARGARCGVLLVNVALDGNVRIDLFACAYRASDFEVTDARFVVG